MPAKIKVRIISGRDLPVMDRASDLTDAFVEVKFGQTTYKTDVYRKSLRPQWNSEWFKFEVDDEDLQDEPLQLRVLDHDTYSAHDAIGKVYIDLDPLLQKDGAAMINGWFPIYDTMHGIRGEIQLIVKVDLFTDVNRYRQSSCGVQFFGTACVPYCYKAHTVFGFVEELVVNDDPEYQWIDKIRTPRASNEARQRLFSQLSGELQRKIGLKVLEYGGNAVIGYRQCFDLEGESGIVVRGIGTAVSLSRVTQLSSPPSSSPVRDPHSHHSSSKSLLLPNFANNLTTSRASPLPLGGVLLTEPMTPMRLAYSPFAFSYPVPEDAVVTSSSGLVAMTTPTKLNVSSPIKTGAPGSNLHRRSSDSDLSTTPKGSLTGSSGSGSGGKVPFVRGIQPQSIEMLEYPFFTIRSFPPGFLVHLCGVVSARSVKLLDRIHNPDEPETRDAWWTEIRTEIRSHARAMGCHAVVGYSEQTSIFDEIIILSASGTAAIVNLNLPDRESLTKQVSSQTLTMSLDRQAFEKEKRGLHVDVNLANMAAQGGGAVRLEDDIQQYDCHLCHVPYSASSAPFPVSLSRCGICRKKQVPDLMFTTVEPPADLLTVGKGCLVQARICRSKKEAKGETNAKEISDNLPFMEYELHHQLMNKLKIKGMNALFGLKIEVAVGETMLVAVASATATFIAALPAPAVPRVSGKETSASSSQDLAELQRQIADTVAKNKDRYELHMQDFSADSSPKTPAVTDEVDEDLNELDLSAGNKDTYILEIDDAEDEAVVSILLDDDYPEKFDICNCERMPGMNNLTRNLQMFTKVWRGEIQHKNNKEFSKIFENLIRSIFFKLRTMIPCVVSDLNFSVALPDEDNIQISATAMCIQSDPFMQNILNSSTGSNRSSGRSTGNCGDQEEMMFHMEDDGDAHVQQYMKATIKAEKRVCQPYTVFRHGVQLTSMSYVPGGKIDCYLGNINFFYIRESTSIRENGGLSGFMHSFVAEVLAIVRAQVAALGGNALVAYRMSECVLEDNPHKNQAQCLINVSGDAVSVLYDAELALITSQTEVAFDTISKSSQTSLGVISRKSGQRVSPGPSPIAFKKNFNPGLVTQV